MKRLTPHVRPADEPGGERPQPYLAFTAAGPILVMTMSRSDGEIQLKQGLRRRGHGKFIAWPVPYDRVQRAYGIVFDTIASNLSNQQPLRVLDFDGRRVFETVSVSRLRSPVVSED